MQDQLNNPKSPRCPRLPANDRVLIRGIEGEAWAVNWSSMGCCLMAERPLVDGFRYMIEFPDRYARGLAGVVWTRAQPDGCLAGLRFLSLDRRAVCF